MRSKREKSPKKVWIQKQGPFAYPGFVVNPAYETLLHLSYEDLIALTDTNADYRKLILNDEFWGFKAARATQGLTREKIGTLIGKAVVNAEYYFVRALLKAYPEKGLIHYKYIQTLLKLCDDTPGSKAYFDILLLLEPIYEEEIIFLISGAISVEGEDVLSFRQNDRFVYRCLHPYRFHPKIYFYFMTEYNFANPILSWRMFDICHASWMMRFYKLLLPDMMQALVFSEDTYAPNDLNYLTVNEMFKYLLKTQNVPLLKEFLALTPEVYSLTVGKKAKPNRATVELLINRKNVDLKDFYARTASRASHGIPEAPLVMKILKQDQRLVAKVAAKPQKKAYIRTTAVILPQDAPLYLAIKKAVQERDINALSALITDYQDGSARIVITYTTEDDNKHTFFLNNSSLTKMSDFLHLPKGTTLSPEMTSDYVYDFIVRPISEIEVRLV